VFVHQVGNTQLGSHEIRNKDFRALKVDEPRSNKRVENRTVVGVLYKKFRAISSSEISDQKIGPFVFLSPPSHEQNVTGSTKQERVTR